MSIRISKENCIGCGCCVSVCPGNLIELGRDSKAVMAYPKDCWGCASCLKECPADAINFFLGADIGGRGSFMTFDRSGNIYDWIVHFPDGSSKTIEVDSESANKY
jgi:adenylylsulfate reductase subunit B